MAEARVVIKGYDELKSPLKQAQSELTGFGQVANQVGSMLSKAFTVAAIVKGLQELSKAVKECIDDFKEQVEVETRLNAVIEATNQQYKYTTREVKNYAQALQEQTRFADDAIESAAQLLIATKKFDKEGLERTLDLSADLAEAMGTDITSAASTLSKALVEPGEGLNRLKTIGITFTDAEEDMIKSLREAGRELEAQQVILDKVEASYGGVAKSIGSIDTSTLDKIKNVWGDLKEDLGSLFTTTLSPIFNWIYNTLRWLERLASQVAEKANLNQWLMEGNTNRIADNFTTDYLQKEIDKRMEQSAYQDIINNRWLQYYTKQNNMTMQEFLSKSSQQQIELMQKWTPNNLDFIATMNGQLAEFRKINNEINLLNDAITQIEQDVLDSEIFAATEAAAKEAADAAKAAEDAVDAVLKKYGSSSETYKATELEKEIANVQGILERDDLGAFLRTVLEEILESLISQRKVEETIEEYVSNPTSGLGFSFGIKSSFGLPQNNAMMGTDTMSILGPSGASKLDLGGSSILALDDMFHKYVKLSTTYQMDALEEEIDTLLGYMEKYVDEDSPIATYLNEIVGNLNSQLEQMKKSTKGSTSGSGTGGGLANIGAAVENLENAGKAVWEDFKEQAGEAGELINRLTTNMAQFGPLLGAIVTALHYVIQGFMEEIGGLLEEFVTWGLEPLRELGRMIGQIITPIFKEIMPSVIASGKVLMKLFQAIATLLTPIVETLMRVIGPLLSVLADVLVTIVGTISWAIEWLAYAISWVLNKITFGWVEQTARPGALNDYLSSMYADPGAGYEGIDSTSGVNAAYSGVTNIYMNVVNNGYVVGDAGLQEFALVIRNELADMSYYSR